MAQTLPSDPEPLIRRLYASFNARSIDAVLASLAPDVVWANGMEGGHVVGHEGVRSYWQRQFSQIRSSVTPVAIDPGADGRVRVQVHQKHRNPQWHRRLERNGSMASTRGRSPRTRAVRASRESMPLLARLSRAAVARQRGLADFRVGRSDWW